MNEGIIKPATDVDHVIPHRGNRSLFWDEENWQALCHEVPFTEDGSRDVIGIVSDFSAAFHPTFYRRLCLSQPTSSTGVAITKLPTVTSEPQAK